MATGDPGRNAQPSKKSVAADPSTGRPFFGSSDREHLWSAGDRTKTPCPMAQLDQDSDGRSVQARQEAREARSDPGFALFCFCFLSVKMPCRWLWMFFAACACAVHPARAEADDGCNASRTAGLS